MRWDGKVILFVTREQHCDFVRELYNKGYKVHHRAKCPRMFAIGRDSNAVSAIVIPYKGRFGKGVKVIIPKRTTSPIDTAIYYIKESNQLDKKGRSK